MDATPLPDAAADAAPDAAPDASFPFYEDCDPQLRDTARVSAFAYLGPNNRDSLQHLLTVTWTDETSFHAEQDPLVDLGRKEEVVTVIFPAPIEPGFDIPLAGEEIIVMGITNCDEFAFGYLRITTPEGLVLFEGGAPHCPDLPGFFEWEDPPYLGQRPIFDSEVCNDNQGMPPHPPECCCIERRDEEVILHPDGDSVLVPGVDREIEIGGHRYLASSQGGFSIRDNPCTQDLTGLRGSAFVVKLRDE